MLASGAACRWLRWWDTTGACTCCRCHLSLCCWYRCRLCRHCWRHGWRDHRCCCCNCWRQGWWCHHCSFCHRCCCCCCCSSCCCCCCCSWRTRAQPPDLKIQALNTKEYNFNVKSFLDLRLSYRSTSSFSYMAAVLYCTSCLRSNAALTNTTLWTNLFRLAQLRTWQLSRANMKPAMANLSPCGSRSSVARALCRDEHRSLPSSSFSMTWYTLSSIMKKCVRPQARDRCCSNTFRTHPMPWLSLARTTIS
mmetsp:Transcript_19208/g.41479  ORF Transcript_19208/g.41479 Transcript_19208/m.41479 type:complete len:250 (+) Transcript_19208:1605-2354(+)